LKQSFWWSFRSGATERGKRFQVFIDIEAVEQAFVFPYLVDILYYNSNKFILIGLFLLINLIITYRKLIYNKAKDDNSINLVNQKN